MAAKPQVAPLRRTRLVDDATQALRDAILDGRLQAGPRRSLFALGHSGWAPGQLEAEMRAGHWVAVPADEALVFDEDYDGKWPRAMARRAINL